MKFHPVFATIFLSGSLGLSLSLLASACGSSSPDDLSGNKTDGGGAKSGSGGKDGGPGGSGGIKGTGGAATGGATGTGGASGCLPAAQPCTHPDQCCDNACVDGVCVEFGACVGAGTDCTAAAQCCSGRCEPVTGQPGVRQCLNFCKLQGQACTAAHDCCSLGCVGGVCGTGPCTLEGEACSANAECCSNICGQDGKCQIDPANSECRPTGEDCSSGPQNGCCEICNEQTGLCEFGSSTCMPQGAACTSDASCCKGKCLPNGAGQTLCQTPCAADGNACTQDADCCGFSCVGGVCGPPPTACTPIAGACTTNADCCTSFCLNGLCDLACTPTSGKCTVNGDCCSGLCTGGVCTPLIK